jgi:hypothetical protein
VLANLIYLHPRGVMHFQFDMSAAAYPHIDRPSQTGDDIPDLLRQILEVSREQLNQQRAFAAAHDGQARWRAFVARWKDNFPDLPDTCREAMPILERAFGKMVSDMTEHLCQEGDDALDDDFSLQEFLDRFGTRLPQMGTILTIVGPLADTAVPSEAT